MKKIILILTCFIITAFISSVWAVGETVDVNYDNGIYHIVLNGKKVARRIKFVASEDLITNKEAHTKADALLTINAGFFDPNNQKTISYIVTGRSTSADPLFNENLTMNPVLRQHLGQITNRTEFRVLECSGKYHYEIVPHNTPVEFGCAIETSAQGGPMILPELKLEEEFFVVKDKNGKVIRESASVLEKTARTIIGIKGCDIHILIITNKNPMDIYQVKDLCEKLGFDRAMAFDGGSSTSLNYKKSIDVVSTSSKGGRMLKSFMIIDK